MPSQVVNSRWDTTTNRDFYKAGILAKTFDDTDTKALIFYKQLVKEESTKDSWIRHAQISGLLPGGELQEGQNIPLQTVEAPLTKTFYLKRWGAGFRMTAWADKYNKFNQYERLTRSLKKVQAVTKDIEVHRMFNNPTSSTYQGTGFDGQVLAYATHTGLLSGSTDDNYDNILSATPSYAALADIRYYFKTAKDALGQYMGMEPDILVFEPTLWPTIREILDSSKLAFEMSNTESPWKGWIKPVEDPRLTSTTAWFVLGKKDENFGLYCFTGQEPTFVVKDAPDATMDKQVFSEQHFSIGFDYPKHYLCGNV
jgi:hypothetical protein